MGTNRCAQCFRPFFVAVHFFYNHFYFNVCLTKLTGTMQCNPSHAALPASPPFNVSNIQVQASLPLEIMALAAFARTVRCRQIGTSPLQSRPTECRRWISGWPPFTTATPPLPAGPHIFSWEECPSSTKIALWAGYRSGLIWIRVGLIFGSSG